MLNDKWLICQVCKLYLSSDRAVPGFARSHYCRSPKSYNKKGNLNPSDLAGFLCLFKLILSIAMSTTSSSEIQQLQKLIEDGFTQLDRKIDAAKSELKQETAEVKSELKQEITEVKSELKQEITEAKSEFKQEIAEVKSELKQEIAEVKSEFKQEIAEAKSEFKQEIGDIRGDIKAVDARFKNVETAVQKIPEITEKFGELKNWRQIAFIILAAIAGWSAESSRF